MKPKSNQQSRKQEPLPEQEVIESESSSSYSSEDDDAKLLTNRVESKLLSVVAMIRNKNPQIYQVDKPIFNDDDFQQQGKEAKKKEKEDKKMTYKQMVQQEEASGEQQEEAEGGTLSMEKIKMNIKSKLMKPLEDNDDDDMFKVKEKHSRKKEKEEKKGKQQINQKQKISAFLNETFKNEGDQSKQILGNLWTHDEHLDDTDKFLRNYILDKKWMTSKHHNPEQVNEEQAMIDEEDEERSVEMDEYEANYNFRFEQPDGNKIVQYPRNVPESLRVKPETRKEKRKRLQQKKKEEEEQIRRQAEEKKQQVRNQILSKLSEEERQKKQHEMVDENEEIQEEADLDHDWFFCDDCTKPLQENQLHFVCPECEDYMLCESCFDLIIHKHPMNKSIIPKGAGPPQKSAAQKILTGLKSCRNCRRRIPDSLKRYEYLDRASYITSSLCQKCYDESNLQIKKKFKPIQPKQVNYEELLDKNPEKIKELTCQKDIEELVDEYIKYDFEDILADGQKAKFKYISVKPQSYGLSDEQILYGDDKEMNKYVSIKKLAPYRDDQGILRLRNSVYNDKIKGIQRSMARNKKIIEKSGTTGVKGVRKLDKLKSRAQILRKRRMNMRNKLKLVDISKVEDEKRYFIPNSRLESYGLAASRYNNKHQ